MVKYYYITIVVKISCTPYFGVQVHWPPLQIFHLVSASVPGQFAPYSFQGPIFLLVKKITRWCSPPSSAYYYHTKFAFCHCCSQTYPNYKSVVPMSSFQQEVIQFALVCHLAYQFHPGSSLDSLLGFPHGSPLSSSPLTWCTIWWCCSPWFITWFTNSILVHQRVHRDTAIWVLCLVWSSTWFITCLTNSILVHHLVFCLAHLGSCFAVLFSLLLP